MHRINRFFKQQEVDEIGVHLSRGQKLLILALAVYLVSILFQCIFMAIRQAGTWTALVGGFGWLLIGAGIYTSYRRRKTGILTFGYLQLGLNVLNIILWPVMLWYYTSSFPCSVQCAGPAANGILSLLFLLTLAYLVLTTWAAILILRAGRLLRDENVTYDIMTSPPTPSASAYRPPSYMPAPDDESQVSLSVDDETSFSGSSANIPITTGQVQIKRSNASDESSVFA